MQELDVKIIISILVINISILFADDAILKSSGGNVFLDSSNSIEMAKEYVYIKMYRDNCKVYCKYWFVNHANSQTILVGFPDAGDFPDSGEPLNNFRIKVNGKSMDYNQKKEVDTEFEYFNMWYTWQTYFPANDTTIIENWYTSGLDRGYIDVGYKYLIGTGQSWKNKIGNGTIIFDLSEVASTNFVTFTTNNIDINITREFNKIIYSFNSYKPSLRNDKVSVWVMSYWDFLNEGFIKQYFKNNTSYTKETLRLMRNEIYARHGYIFKANDLNNYFKMQPWYKVNDKFTFSDLNEFEKKVIVLLKNMEDSMSSTNVAQNDSLNIFILPLEEGRVVKEFGNTRHPILKSVRFHPGIDISSAKGSNVHAIADGLVDSVGFSEGYGNKIIIKHMAGYISIYGHLDIILVKRGMTVRQKDIIGLVGSTGLATAPHLHFEIWKDDKSINPMQFYSGIPIDHLIHDK